jgi:hypothetical protein
MLLDIKKGGIDVSEDLNNVYSLLLNVQQECIENEDFEKLNQYIPVYELLNNGEYQYISGFYDILSSAEDERKEAELVTVVITDASLLKISKDGQLADSYELAVSKYDAGKYIISINYESAIVSVQFDKYGRREYIENTENTEQFNKKYLVTTKGYEELNDFDEKGVEFSEYKAYGPMDVTFDWICEQLLSLE